MVSCLRRPWIAGSNRLGKPSSGTLAGEARRRAPRGASPSGPGARMLQRQLVEPNRGRSFATRCPGGRARGRSRRARRGARRLPPIGARPRMPCPGKGQETADRHDKTGDQDEDPPAPGLATALLVQDASAELLQLAPVADHERRLVACSPPGGRRGVGARYRRRLGVCWRLGDDHRLGIVSHPGPTLRQVRLGLLGDDGGIVDLRKRIERGILPRQSLLVTSVLRGSLGGRLWG